MQSYLLFCCFLVLCGAVLVSGQEAGFRLSRRRPGRPCGPVCFIYCPCGNVLDRWGCPLCQCNECDRRCPDGRRPFSSGCNPFVLNSCGYNGYCYAPADGSGICCRRQRPRGQCPPVRSVGFCPWRRHRGCVSDADCPGVRRRCCPDRCGRVCKRVTGFPRW